MAVDTKSIQNCLWKILKLSMKSCYNFVKKYPVLSSVSISFFLLYMFLPSVFTFLLYSLLVLVLAVVVYRVYKCINYEGTENVKDYKKNDENPSIVRDDLNVGENVSVSAHDQSARRRNAKEKDKEDHTRADIEDKSMVYSTRFNDVLIDKSAVVEENLKEIREVKVDSVNGSAECSLSNASQCVRPPSNFGSDEGAKKNSGGKGETEGESSEDSEGEEDARVDRNKVVEWTADDQKNLMDLGDSEIERNKRLENLIVRRKARKLLSLQVRNTLMSSGNNDSRDPIASILVRRNNPFLPNDSSNPISPIPGSAPSVLLPRHNPFDLPYDPQEEKPNLMGDSFHQEFLADHQKDMMFCRHESFSLGPFFPMQDRYETFFNEFPLKQKSPEISENSRIGSQLDKKDVNKLIENESSQESEAIFNGGSAEDHTTQQASERAFDLIDVHNEEDRSEVEAKQLEENINDGSISSSSSEENISISKTNKDAILRSLSFLTRKNTTEDKYDNGRAKDDSYDIFEKTGTKDPFFYDNKEMHHAPSNSLDGRAKEDSYDIFEKTRTKDPFFYGNKEMHHAPNNSLASDMQVEISEVSSPRSISSPDEESLMRHGGMKKEITSDSEEMCAVSSHLSGVDEHESKSREVHEVSEQDIIEVGFSRINHKLDSITCDIPEKVVEQDSSSPSKTDLPESIQAHAMDFKPEHPGASDSLDASSNFLEFEKAQNLTKEVVAHTSPINSEKPEELIPQEINIVNESVYHNNNGKESLSSPVATAELTIPAEETDNKSVKDTDVMFDKLSDLASSKASVQNDNSFVPFANEDDSSVYHQKPSQETDISYPVDKSVSIDNEAKINSDSVKDTEGEVELLIKHVDLLEPTNSSSSKSIEDTEENPRNVDAEKGVVSPSKATEENKNSCPEIKIQEFQKPKIDEVIDQPKAADAKENLEAIKAVEDESKTWTRGEAIFDLKQKDLKDDMSNPVGHLELKEPLDPPVGRSTEEGYIIFNHNEPVISASDDKELNHTVEAM